jgi:hypothetical protein
MKNGKHSACKPSQTNNMGGVVVTESWKTPGIDIKGISWNLTKNLMMDGMWSQI